MATTGSGSLFPQGAEADLPCRTLSCHMVATAGVRGSAGQCCIASCSAKLRGTGGAPSLYSEEDRAESMSAHRCASATTVLPLRRTPGGVSGVQAALRAVVQQPSDVSGLLLMEACFLQALRTRSSREGAQPPQGLQRCQKSGGLVRRRGGGQQSGTNWFFGERVSPWLWWGGSGRLNSGQRRNRTSGHSDRSCCWRSCLEVSRAGCRNRRADLSDRSLCCGGCLTVSRVGCSLQP